MAKTPQQDILTRMTNLVPDALHRLQDIPGGQRLVELANESKLRLDEMQKRLRGLDELEKRVAKLEQQLAAQKAKKPAARKTASSSSARKPAAKKTT
jgi:hypothetical protein